MEIHECIFKGREDLVEVQLIHCSQQERSIARQITRVEQSRIDVKSEKRLDKE